MRVVVAMRFGVYGFQNSEQAFVADIEAAAASAEPGVSPLETTAVSPVEIRRYKRQQKCKYTRQKIHAHTFKSESQKN